MCCGGKNINASLISWNSAVLIIKNQHYLLFCWKVCKSDKGLYKFCWVLLRVRAEIGIGRSSSLTTAPLSQNYNYSENRLVKRLMLNDGKINYNNYNDYIYSSYRKKITKMTEITTKN